MLFQHYAHQVYIFNIEGVDNYLCLKPELVVNYFSVDNSITISLSSQFAFKNISSL